MSTSPSNATPQANRDRALELIRHPVRAAHRVSSEGLLAMDVEAWRRALPAIRKALS